MLEYDDSAFYYFFLTLTGFYLIPATYYALKTIVSAFCCREDVGEARTALEREKMAKMKKEHSVSSMLCTKGFVLHMIMVTLVWAVFLYVLMLVEVNSEIAQFDPYKILGIEHGATEREIKKAYRTQSLEYHPDKNPGDSKAEAMFVMVAKAHEALTDEVARENYEKWGNPDGKQALAVSLGLPTFLMDADNHKAVLMVYLMVLVIFIPTVVALWYNKSKRYGDRNVLYDTYGFYNHALSEHAHLRMLPEVFAGSAEFRRLPSRVGGEAGKAMDSLSKKLRTGPSSARFFTPRFKHPLILKPNMLLHAHLMRMELPRELVEDTKFLLAQAPKLLDAMIELSFQKRWKMTTIFIVDFCQLLTQGLWMGDNPLLQLPHFGPEEIKHALHGKRGNINFRSFLKNDTKKGTARMTPEQVADVEAVCKMMPEMTWELSIGVEDEENVVAGDLLTVTAKCTRRNLEEGEVASAVHAPLCPGRREEKWYLMVAMHAQNTLITMNRVTNQAREFEEKLRFGGPPKAGTYKFDVIMKCDSYVGMDLMQTIEVKVLERDILPEFKAHPDDAALDDDPTLFGQMMGAMDDSDSDSDDVAADSDDEGEESEEVEEVEVKKEAEGGVKKRQGKKLEE